ncbi:MAG: hypothetical protein MOGMAGMI_00304 [Candidatus Omnitrophica bacterium]|nr:hypothetical protein [Candidatus Omnitrophota bacterium]
MGFKTNLRAQADKVLNVLSVPNEIFTGSTTPVKVGKGNLCRIEGTSGGFVRFAAEGDVTVPTSSTRETIKTESGFFYVRATNEYIICSASMRVEVTGD